MRATEWACRDGTGGLRSESGLGTWARRNTLSATWGGRRGCSASARIFMRRDMERAEMEWEGEHRCGRNECSMPRHVLAVLFCGA